MRMPIHPDDRRRFADLPEWVEWEPTDRDRRYALENHSQTLEVLHSRGGMSWSELAAVLLGRSWRNAPPAFEAATQVQAELARRRPPLAFSGRPREGPGDPRTDPRMVQMSCRLCGGLAECWIDPARVPPAAGAWAMCASCYGAVPLLRIPNAPACPEYDSRGVSVPGRCALCGGEAGR